MLKILLIPLILLVNFTSVKAEEIIDYQVELVFFKHVNSKISNDETFKEGFFYVDTSSSLTIPIIKEDVIDEALSKTQRIDTRQKSQFISPASLENLLLTKIVGSVKRSSQYNLITQSIWRQPGLKSNAKNIAIESGKPFVVLSDLNNEDNKLEFVNYYQLLKEWKLQKSNLINVAVTEAISEEEIPAKIEIPIELRNYLYSLGKDVSISYPLAGNVKVVRTRYLHLYTDLMWNVVSKVEIQKIPVANKNTDDSKTSEVETQNTGVLENEYDVTEIKNPLLTALSYYNVQSYPFKSHRKMRSKKKHFIDHPKLGLIAIIVPIEKDEDIIDQIKR